MKKEIRIPYYTNCYGLSDLSCDDLLLAAATGHFATDNYFHYAFYEAIRSNWLVDEAKSWLEDKQEKLQLFGVDLQPITVQNAAEFHGAITDHIDNGEIIFLPLKLNRVFYTWAYGEKAPLNHFVLVSGYNTDNDTYTIRDPDVNVDAVRPMIQGNPIYKINVPAQWLAKAWLISNSEFQTEARYANTFYAVCDFNAEVRHVDARQLLTKLISCGSEKRGLASYIEIFNGQLGRRIDFERIRKMYHGAARVVVDYIFRFAFGEDDSMKKEFESFSNVFLANRYKQLAVLHASFLRNKELGTDKIKSMCHVNARADRQLFAFVQLGLQSLNDTDAVTNNYSSLAVARADSVCIPPDKPDDVYKYYAQNVTTGAFDGWCSNKETAEHWINLELQDAKKINKIVIRHVPTALTQDYTVSLQTNEGIWKEVASRKGNCKEVDTIRVPETRVQKIKIEITVPDLNDYYARIRQIEIWGE